MYRLWYNEACVGNKAKAEFRSKFAASVGNHAYKVFWLAKQDLHVRLWVLEVKRSRNKF